MSRDLMREVLTQGISWQAVAIWAVVGFTIIVVRMCGAIGSTSRHANHCAVMRYQIDQQQRGSETLERLRGITADHMRKAADTNLKTVLATLHNKCGRSDCDGGADGTARR